VRIALLTILAVLAMATSVLYASHVQRVTAAIHGREAAAAQSILAEVNRADASLSSFVATGDTEPLGDMEQAVAQLERHLVSATDFASDDAIESAAVARQRRLFASFATLFRADLDAPTDRARRRALRRDAAKRHELVDQIAATNDALRRRQALLATREDRRAALIPPLLILALSLAFGGLAAVVLRGASRTARRRARHAETQARFAEAMQVSDSQAEAHGLLKAHLERSIPGTSITVINRNNSADRLEANTPLAEGSPLETTLREARPRSCMAVRLTRPFSTGAGSDEVLSCEVCGDLSSNTTCQPLLVGGEVIGAVLGEHEGQLVDDDAERIAESVAQAAPVLANLRNLAIAETRAATDTLTGLPNRRAVDDTLLRMLAQAGRTFEPLAIILLDLDHFKQVNDTYGHDRGDEVLAAFAARLRELVRESDFAGRSGGEEFVLFLPGTDRTGALRLAEKLRMSLRGMTVPGVERSVTASFGIACFPDDAVDAPALMRSADRALYAAKRGGRDRIEASSTGAAAPIDEIAPHDDGDAGDGALPAQRASTGT
jgi:diguanylate cyclase (GGDEF)-like protein